MVQARRRRRAFVVLASVVAATGLGAVRTAAEHSGQAHRHLFTPGIGEIMTDGDRRVGVAAPRFRMDPNRLFGAPKTPHHG